ncbi:hypothetical protein UY3_15175 [Chelonia mydas]|uniref:Uncharacterized protein n=1 Tax=Chelonia mydas TaxID=8469 RepID=M7AXD8_CHEMY|nr:hypothetical protein UY3_15175 [Chelonia mydas]
MAAAGSGNQHVLAARAASRSAHWLGTVNRNHWELRVDVPVDSQCKHCLVAGLRITLLGQDDEEPVQHPQACRVMFNTFQGLIALWARILLWNFLH